MHKKSLVLFTMLISTSLSAADNKLKPNKLRPTPPATPPIHNSPAPLKKEFPVDGFEIVATQIGIRTADTGEEQNLQTYVHHNLHQIHEKLSTLQTKAKSLQAEIDARASMCNKGLEGHKQETTRQFQAMQTEIATHAAQPTMVTFTNIDGDEEEKPLNYAIQHLQQDKERYSSALDDQNKRLKLLEATQKPPEVTLHKSWPRWIMDHFVASALVATGLYHSSALHSIITQTMPVLVRSSITKALPYLPYACVPASVVFAGMLATDMHHNLQETAFNNQRSDWKAYCAHHRFINTLYQWAPDFFVSTTLIAKTFADNISHVLTPACKYMLVAGIALAIAKSPKIA